MPKKLIHKARFYTPVFDWNLLVVVYDSGDPASFKEFKKLLKGEGLSLSQRSAAASAAYSRWGFCFQDGVSKSIIGIQVDLSKPLTIGSKIRILTVLQHECGHFRQAVLDDACEAVATTDTEVYLRISDWAFSSACTMPFFKKKVLK